MAGAKKSPFAVRMDGVQAAIDPSLKQLGFRKSGRTYNRETDPGIVQVINFQMGPYEPPIAGVTPVPASLMPDLYGWFSVNLDVFIEEISAVRDPFRRGKFIREPECPIRRLGRLIAPAGRILVESGAVRRNDNSGHGVAAALKRRGVFGPVSAAEHHHFGMGAV